jgi:hypothetical protein
MDAKIFFAEAALSHSNLPSLSSQTVYTISSIHETRLPKVNDPARWRLWAVVTFLCIQGPLGMELTLLWNRVSGFNNLGSVGELVTFVIGVGGFVKMILMRTRAQFKGEEEQDLTPSEILHKSLADTYYPRKDAEGAGISRQMTLEDKQLEISHV